MGFTKKDSYGRGKRGGTFRAESANKQPFWAWPVSTGHSSARYTGHSAKLPLASSQGHSKKFTIYEKRDAANTMNEWGVCAGTQKSRNSDRHHVAGEESNRSTTKNFQHGLDKKCTVSWGGSNENSWG